jgi:hypothetical protein
MDNQHAVSYLDEAEDLISLALERYISIKSFRDLLDCLSTWDENRFKLYAVLATSTPTKKKNSFVLGFDFQVMSRKEGTLSVSDSNGKIVVKTWSQIDNYRLSESRVADFITSKIMDHLEDTLKGEFEVTELKFLLDSVFDNIAEDVAEVDKDYYEYFDKAQHYTSDNVSDEDMNDVKYPMTSLKCMTDIMCDLLEHCKSVSDTNVDIKALQSIVDKNKSASKYQSWFEHIESYNDILKFMRSVAIQ